MKNLITWRQLICLLFLFSCCIFSNYGCQSQATTEKTATPNKQTAEEFLLERSKSLDLGTPYNPPPGDALSHHISGFAKVMCSGIFITGLEADFVAENIGYFSAPYEHRAKVIKREVDMENKAVHLTLPNGTVRTAKFYGDQGCLTLPVGEEKPFFTPVTIASSLPDPATLNWPMGDKIMDNEVMDGVDLDKVQQAVNAAFNPKDGMTAGFIITHKGKIIGERYKDGIDSHTPLESWSMGKSLTATLMGVLIQQGVYELHQPAPIPEWQGEGDERAKIRISDILRMSSGLRFRAPQDPDFDETMGYPDHLYVYTGSVNSFEFAASLPQQWKPNTVGRYRNCDPVLTNYLVRLGVEGKGEDYLSFPQRALFDKIGVRDMVMETDPYGNYLLQGYEFGTPRDWARLGNLYLQDGVWTGLDGNAERILPEGFANFVSSLAPSWEADRRPIYGGFFWLNGDGNFPIPKNAYYMAGAGGQMTIIIPTHDLVVVRLGHYKGSAKGMEALKASLAILMEAIPQS